MQRCNRRSIAKPVARSRPASDSVTTPTRSSARLATSRIRRAAGAWCREHFSSPAACVNFLECRGLALQAMALDHRTMLGPQLRIQSADTLRRLLAYLGATPEQLTDYDNCQRRWGQGHCPDHASAVPQEPAQDRLSAAFTRNGLRPARDTFQLGHPEKIRRMKDDPMKWDGKVYRPAGEGFRWDTADGAQRKAQNARRRKKYAQMRAEEVRDGFVRNPKWQEPTLWHASGKRSANLFPPRRRY